MMLRLMYTTAILAALLVSLPPVSASSEVFVEGELIVGLADSVDIDTVNALYGTTDVQTLPQLHVWQVNTPAGSNLDSIAELIEQEPFVDFCHPNYIVDPLEPVQGSIPFGDGTDPDLYVNQQAANTLGLSNAQTISDGENVSVAILDGGVDFNHPAFEGTAVSGWDYVDDDGNAFDEPGGLNSGHGTFVAGVVHLVAPEAEIRAYRVTNLSGESNGYIVAEAILQAVADGCRVINLSMVMMGEHEAIAEAVQYARDNDVLVVVAAGNGGNEQARYPASDANTMAVAAVDSNLALADFSSFGEFIDICAPGTMIYSPYLDSLYAWWGGTSFAAPFVTAMSALLLSFDQNLTWEELRGYILDTATPLDSLNPDHAGMMGAGLISPFDALMALRGGAITIHVPSEYPTIQMAIDSALAGDTILVAPGTYYGMIHYSSKPLVILSEQGPEVTILRPMADDTRLVYMEGNFLIPPELIGFTVTGLCSDYAVVEVGFSPALIRDCIFHSNQLCGEDYPVVQADHTALDIRGCLFYGNGGTSLLLGSESDGSIAAANTFDRNVDGLYCWPFATPIVRNNIITNNTGTGADIHSSSDFDYNNVWGNNQDYDWQTDAGENDISEEPLYVDPLRGDYRLLPGSPCIDAGDPDPQYNDPDGSRADIGAFPAEPMVLPLPINVTLTPEADLDMAASLIPTFHWEYYDTSSSTQTGFEIEVGTDNDWSSAELWDYAQYSTEVDSTSYAGAALSPFSTYYYRLRLQNTGGWGDWMEFSFTTSTGGTINVPGDAGTIQAAIDIATEGDTVVVDPGSYVEAIHVANKNLVLTSSGGADVTVIEAPTAGAVAAGFEGSVDTMSSISGFTIDGGSVGINCYSGAAPRIIGNEITNASVAGIYMDGASGSIIRANVIEGNGQAVEVHGGTVSIENNLIVNNEAPWGTDAVLSLFINDSVFVSGNIIARNGGQKAIYLYHGTGHRIENNTLFGNRAGGMEIRWVDQASICNNLIAFNSGGFGIAQYYAEDDSVNYEYNNSYGNFPSDWLNVAFDVGNISTDPLFADTSGNAFELLAGSPCVDAGHPDPQYNDPDGTRNDIGATPLGPVSYPLALEITATPSDSGIVLSTTPDILWSYTDTSATSQTQYHVQVGDDMDWTVAERWDTGPLGGSNTSVTYAGASLDDLTRYFVRVRVHDGAGWGDWCYGTFLIKIATTISVPGDTPTIQGAVDVSRDGDTIWVSPGTYQEQIDFRGRDILLKSTDGPEVTFLEPPPDVYPMVRFSGGSTDNATLEGFGVSSPDAKVHFEVGAMGTLRGNHFIGLNDLAVKSNHCNGGVIENNVFDSCIRPVHLYGGYWRIVGNTFVNNTNDGSNGALTCFHTDSGYIARNLFANNTVASGGVIQLYGWDESYLVHNNTFANNISEVGTYVAAILIDRLGACTVVNNVIAFNESMYGIWADDDWTYSDYVIEYNDVYANELGEYWGQSPGIGSFSADPLFVDTAAGDYSLSALSPCIDAGHPGMQWVDPDGSVNDVGAFPYDGPVLLPVAVNLSAAPGDLTHILGDSPTLYWSFSDTVGSPSGYEIEVGTNNDWAVAEMWSSGQIMTPDTSAVYAGSELVDGTTYYLRIRVYNGTNWGDWRGSVFHANAVPTAPAVVSPADGDTVGMTGGLQVSGSPDPEGDMVTYGFEMYSDPGLTDLVFEVEGIGAGEDTASSGPPTGLAHRSQYYWRARAFDSYEHSEWTETQSMFVIANINIETVSGGDLNTNRVFCDGPIEFIFRITNEQPNWLVSTANAFELSTPDSAEWDLVGAEWYNPGFDWTNVFDLYAGASVMDGASADTVAFQGGVLTGDGFDPGRSEQAWTVTVEIDCSQQGKTICLDTLHSWSPGGSWAWQLDGTPGTLDPGWHASRCFTIEQCCFGVRGDINGDGTDTDISDVIYLVGYMFQDGPEPLCPAEANVNGDAAQELNITDLVYMVGYMFNQGAAPLPCDSVLQQAPAKLSAESPRLTRTYANDSTVITIETPVPLSGVEMHLESDEPVAISSPIDSRLELYYHQNGDRVAVGILDIDGTAVIPAGATVLCRMDGNATIASALTADLHYQGLIPEIDNHGKAGAPVPETFALHQNYPNPFNAATVIKYDLPQPSQVQIDVYNILGQTVATLVDDYQPAGYHQVHWSGKNDQGGTVASGVYFYRISTDSHVESRKMLLLK